MTRPAFKHSVLGANKERYSPEKEKRRLGAEKNDAFVGSLWILEVNSVERAEELVVNDPHFNADLRECKIRVWGKAGNRDAVLLSTLQTINKVLRESKNPQQRAFSIK